MITQTFRTILTCLWRMTCWSGADAALGTLCAGLFGFVYGGLNTLIDGDPSRLFLTVGYFSLCGAMAGAILGATGALIEEIDVPAPVPDGGGLAQRQHRSHFPATEDRARSFLLQRPSVSRIL